MMIMSQELEEVEVYQSLEDQHQTDESKSEMGDDTATFDIKKNKKKDDYSKYKEILENE